MYEIVRGSVIANNQDLSATGFFCGSVADVKSDGFLITLGQKVFTVPTSDAVILETIIGVEEGNSIIADKSLIVDAEGRILPEDQRVFRGGIPVDVSEKGDCKILLPDSTALTIFAQDVISGLEALRIMFPCPHRNYFKKAFAA